MALLQATSIEDYFSSSPVKKRKRSPGENNIQSTSNDPSSTAISSSSDPTTDSDRNNTANKSTRRAEYDEVPVSELKPGFRGVKVMVRVVNIFEQGMKGGGKGSTGNGVRGCLKILGKDGEGVILVCVHVLCFCFCYDWWGVLCRGGEERDGGGRGEWLTVVVVVFRSIFTMRMYRMISVWGRLLRCGLPMFRG